MAKPDETNSAGNVPLIGQAAPTRNTEAPDRGQGEGKFIARCHDALKP